MVVVLDEVAAKEKILNPNVIGIHIISPKSYMMILILGLLFFSIINVAYHALPWECS